MPTRPLTRVLPLTLLALTSLGVAAPDRVDGRIVQGPNDTYQVTPVDMTYFTTGLNSSGVVGGLGIPSTGPVENVPVIWERGRRLRIPSPPEGAADLPGGIADNGDFTGIIQTPGGKLQACLWKDFQPAVLPNLPGGDESFGFDVNDDSVVAGRATDSMNRNIPCKWENGAISTLGLSDQVMGTLLVNAPGHILVRAGGNAGLLRNGGFTSVSGALAFNDTDDVVGLTTDEVTRRTFAYIWSGAFATTLTVPQNATGSYAQGIAANKDVLGSYTTKTATVPVMWRGGGGQPIPLSTLLQGTGLQGTISPLDISARGHLLLMSTPAKGPAAYFLLTPPGMHLPDLNGAWTKQPKPKFKKKRRRIVSTTIAGGQFTVRNTADVPAAASRLRLVLSADSLLGGDDDVEVPNGGYDIPALGPGESKLIKVNTFKVKADRTGSILLPIIDPDESLDEQFESNNMTPSERLSR